MVADRIGGCQDTTRSPLEGCRCQSRLAGKPADALFLPRGRAERPIFENATLAF